MPRLSAYMHRARCELCVVQPGLNEQQAGLSPATHYFAGNKKPAEAGFFPDHPNILLATVLAMVDRP